MGSNGSQSQSTPITGGQRADTYQEAIGEILGNQNAGTTSLPGEYQPAVTSAGAPQQMSNGDYQQLQETLTKGATAPLDAAKQTDIDRFNNSAASRGIWSSGLAEQGVNDINKAYAPQYTAAGSNAVNTAATLQNNQNQGVNTYNLGNAQLANQQQQAQYESTWRPADYLAGLWNGTGGTVSSASAGGWSV